MPKKVEDWQEDQVIELYLKGYTEKMIEGEADVGHTKQREVIRKFVRESEKLGIDEAAQLHGVREIIEDVHRLSGQLRTHKLTIEDAAQGLVISKRLGQVGLSDDRALDFIDEVMDRVKREAFSVSEVVTYAKEMDDVETETGLSAHGVVEDLKEKAERREKMLAEVDSLTKETKQLETKKEELLKEYESKEEELLKEYESTEHDLKLNRELHRRLSEVGADPAVPDKLIRMVRSAREVDFSPEAFAKKLAEEVSATDRLRELDALRRERESGVAKLVSESRSAAARLKDLSQRIDEVKKELDDLTLKKGVAEYAVAQRAEQLRKLETQFEDSSGRISSLEEVMQKNGVSVKLFKEPSSLTKDEVGAIAVQLRSWSDTMPANVLLEHPAVKMWIDKLATALGGP
jgi:uncharacterized coiled-coil DUF342 family protein